MKFIFPLFLSVFVVASLACKQNTSATDPAEEAVMVQAGETRVSPEQEAGDTPSVRQASETIAGEREASEGESARSAVRASETKTAGTSGEKAEKKEKMEDPLPKTEKTESKPPVQAEKVTPPETKVPAAEAPLSHSLWDELLRQYVSSSGSVNYAGMRSEKAKLDKYLAQLAANPPQEGWSRNEEMAYWINAYNASTVKLILDNYPVKSIRDLHGGNPWDVKWIEIGSKTYSLNQIENEMLRKRFGDARIHFAVNCAARSCPPLLNRAWTASMLSSTLDQRARAFINNPKYNQISAGHARVSKIFEWYAGDFGDLRSFLNRYADTKLNAGATIEYLEYDWSLNGK